MNSKRLEYLAKKLFLILIALFFISLIIPGKKDIPTVSANLSSMPSDYYSISSELYSFYSAKLLLAYIKIGMVVVNFNEQAKILLKNPPFYVNHFFKSVSFKEISIIDKIMAKVSYSANLFFLSMSSN